MYGAPLARANCLRDGNKRNADATGTDFQSSHESRRWLPTKNRQPSYQTSFNDAFVRRHSALASRFLTRFFLVPCNVYPAGFRLIPSTTAGHKAEEPPPEKYPIERRRARDHHRGGGDAESGTGDHNEMSISSSGGHCSAHSIMPSTKEDIFEGCTSKEIPFCPSIRCLVRRDFIRDDSEHNRSVP